MFTAWPWSSFEVSDPGWLLPTSARTSAGWAVGLMVATATHSRITPASPARTRTMTIARMTTLRGLRPRRMPQAYFRWRGPGSGRLVPLNDDAALLQFVKERLRFEGGPGPHDAGTRDAAASQRLDGDGGGNAGHASGAGRPPGHWMR